MPAKPIYDPEAAPDADAGLFGSPFSPDEASLVVVPVPWDVTASYRRGTAGAPEAVRVASHQLDLWDYDNGAVWERGIAMLPIPDSLKRLNEQTERADLDAVNAACAQMNEWVSASVAKWLDAGKCVAVLGGDHSVAFSAIEQHASRHPDMGILQIDAHADLREAYEGYTWSHASIMFNVMERIPKVGSLTQVGVRDLAQSEHERIESDKAIRAYFGQSIAASKHEGALWSTMCREIVATLPKRVYISFDIDGLDPTCCPNTGTPVPGGLSFDEASTLLREVGRSGRTVVGFDLTEVGVSPTQWDENVGARILYKLAGWALGSG